LTKVRHDPTQKFLPGLFGLNSLIAEKSLSTLLNTRRFRITFRS
jgi:hypothetical protein